MSHRKIVTLVNIKMTDGIQNIVMGVAVIIVDLSHRKGAIRNETDGKRV